MVYEECFVGLDADFLARYARYAMAVGQPLFFVRISSRIGRAQKARHMEKETK
jgi:hypothetical protein